MIHFPARLNIAYVTPLNPVPNGLSDYSEMLLPALAKYADLTVYSDCGVPGNAAIAQQFSVWPVVTLQRNYAEHDLRLYQIGNSDHHARAFDVLRRLPGVVVLHEPFLHHGLRAISPGRYRRELEYALGHISAAELFSWQSEYNHLKLLQASTIRRLLETSLGLIVHSHTARRMIETECQQAGLNPAEFNLAVVPHLMPVLPMEAPALYRTEFNLPLDQFIIGVAGTVAPIKEPAFILQAFAQLLSTGVSARLVFAGERPLDYGLSQVIADLGVEAQVTFLERLDPLDRLHRAMAACDILINLRRPTIGETSGTALRALAMGRPLIVRALGWFAELPDEVCVKISPMAGTAELAQALHTLFAESGYRQQLSSAAQSYIRTQCDADYVARQYIEFLQQVYQRIGEPG